jgi:hypothetical protein
MNMEKLDEYVGIVIKVVAIVLFIVEVIGSVIGGIVAFWGDEDAIFLCIIGGPIVAFVSSAFIYAFGELVEKVSIIEGYMTEDRENEIKITHTTSRNDEGEQVKKSSSGKVKKVKETSEVEMNKEGQSLTQLKNELRSYSTDDLKLILKDQSDLYSPEELRVISAELKSRG